MDTSSDLPKVLDVHWQALRACNRNENQAFFLRVKARALRALVIKNGLENLPGGTRENLMSFLKTQDLCVLSECSTELNFRIQNMPRIWQKLAATFELPKDYWPNNDFSKKRCVSNFKSIVGANSELRKLTAESSPVFSFISQRSRIPAAQLRSEIADPQERFTKHTLPVMTAFLVEQAYPAAGFDRTHFDMRKTARGVIPFGPCLDNFKMLLGMRIPENPRSFINLFWTCGYPIHRRVLGCVMFEFGCKKGNHALSPELSSAWLNTLETMAGCIPHWADPEEDREWYRLNCAHDPLFTLCEMIHGDPRDRPTSIQLKQKFYQFSSQEASRLDGLVLQLLQKGETSYHDLVLYLQLCSNLPFKFFEAIMGAMKDKSYLPRLIYIFLYISFVHLEDFYSGMSFEARARVPLKELLMDYHRFTPEKILSMAPFFKGPQGWEHDAAEYHYRRENLGPKWIYQAAKSGSRPLLDLLTDIRIPYDNANPDYASRPMGNSLSLALKEGAPLDVIQLLHEYGVKPSLHTLTYIKGYIATHSDIPDVAGRLRAMFQDS